MELFIGLLTELPWKQSRSSKQSSDDLALQQLVAKKTLHDYTTLKMDLLARDISDLRSESDHKVIIKLLYSNALATISGLLEPHLKEVKEEASRVHQIGLLEVAVGEGIIESADSISSLLNRTGMWDKTRFLRKAVESIPSSAPERSVAEDILSHYHLHLAIYERATFLKDALPIEPTNAESEKAPKEEKKLVPVKITSRKPISSFTCEDCYRIHARVLSKAYGIPVEMIICHGIGGGSTTVTFLILDQYVQDIVQRSTQLPTVWVLLELDIIEVSIEVTVAGVFTFSPSVDCFMTLLRGSKTFTADLLGVTEVRVLRRNTFSLLSALSPFGVVSTWVCVSNLLEYICCYSH